MSTLKEFKGVAFIYLVITIINIFWVVGFDVPEKTEQVSNENNMVVNI